MVIGYRYSTKNRCNTDIGAWTLELRGLDPAVCGRLREPELGCMAGGC